MLEIVFVVSGVLLLGLMAYGLIRMIVYMFTENFWTAGIAIILACIFIVSGVLLFRQI